ncbi:MAG: condensation domain-containing protein, partial [Planctomycetota bacterium]
MDKKNIQAIYPLLNMQHGLLFHSLGNRKNDPGLLQVRFQIQGILDIERLRQSWDTVVQRNEALRMSVQMPQGHQPMMVVSRICQTKWTDLDLRRQSLEEQKSEVDAFLLNDQQKGLKLNSAPAFRIALIHHEENRFQVLWTCHHLFLDGWSAVIAIQKWMSEYEALFVDQVKDPIRQCSYREFLAVRRGLQEGDQLAQTVRFWKNYLNECLPVRLTSSNSEPLANLEKTTKHGQPRTVVTHCLGSELSTLANRFKVTSASLFHAILAMAFKVQTGTDDVLFGETTSGRNYDLDGMNSLLGCFSGVIPRRTIFKESDEILSEFVRRVNKSRFDSISYEHASMSQIEEAAGLVAGKLPMFDCLLVFENLPWKNIEPSDSGIKVTGYSAGITTTFPLTIVVKPATEDLTTSGHWLVEYSYDYRISQTLVTSLSKTVEVLVKKLGGNPDIKIGQLFDETAVFKSDEFPAVSADKGRVVVGDTLNQTGVQLAGNRLQIELSEIWEELLGINPIDVNTDFIQLGGRSILVLRMIAMIESRLGKKISLSDVIENPTIAGLAKKISDEQK